MDAMERVYSSLTGRALRIQKRVQKDQPVPVRSVIALAGPPGSGKSTVAAEVVRRLNTGSSEPVAAVLPMDGFHYSRAELDLLPNREEAYARRGASWTFDADGVLKLVQTLHQSKADSTKVILAPSFDHKLKDPVADSIVISPSISIVILEGNWLLLDQYPWNLISEYVDDTWFIDVAPQLARQRIAKRHLESGIETTWEAALARADGNDLLNGEEVRTRLVRPAIMAESIEITDEQRNSDWDSVNTVFPVNGNATVPTEVTYG